MLKATYWISVVSVPILLVSAGCSIGPWPFSTAKRGLPPERLMAMARTFERQGHYAQAKSTYLQVLASQPDYPDARQSLETLIANEGNPDRLKKAAHPFDQREQMIAQAKAIAEKEAREMAAREDERSPKLAKNDSPKRAKKVERDDVDASTKLASSTRGAIDSNSVRASFKSTDTSIESEVERKPLTTVEPAESSSPESMNALLRDGESKGRSFVSGTIPKPSRVSTVPAISSKEVASSGQSSTVVIGQPPSDHAAIGDGREIGVVKSDTSTGTQSVAGRAGSPDTVSSDAVEKWDLTAISNVPEIRTTPEPLVSSETTEADLQCVDPLTESITFETPIIRRHPLADQSIDQFFGPFHAGMVQTIRENHDQFQLKLAGLVSDQDADIEVRSRAVFLLGSIGPAGVDVVPVLRSEMHDEVDEYLRIDLCEAILKIKPEDKDAINVLVDSLRETDENLRWMAAFALRNAVSPRTTFVIDSLRESLNTQDLKLRRMIFLTLAEFGPAAEKAIPELEEALESPDPATREVAKASLACIAPDRSTTQIIQETSHRNEMTPN